MEEIAAGGKGSPRWIAVYHSSSCCLRDFWNREASSATSLLTRAGACCGLRPSTVGGFHPALPSLVCWVVRPVGAGRLLEAEKGTCLLVDPLLALEGVSEILHILLDDTTCEKSGQCSLYSPENPDPSVARVAISNSRVVSVVG